MAQQKSDPLATSNSNEKYHQTLWDKSPTAQVVYQFDGTILNANQAFADLISRNIVDILGLNIWSITFSGNHHAKAEELECLDKLGKFQTQRIFLDPSNTQIEVKLSGVKIDLEDGDYILLSAEKIVSATFINTSASQSVVDLQQILDELPMAIFWKDCNSTFLGANKVFADVAGFDAPRSLIGKSDYDFPWKKEEADYFRECDRRILDSGVAEYNIIEPQQQADGSQRWLKTNKVALRDADNQVVGVLGTFEDITAKVVLEKQLKEQAQDLETLVEQRTKELISSQIRFEKFVVNIPGAIYQFKQHLDGSFSFPYMSANCEEIFEVSAAKLIQSSELFLSQIHQEDISSFEKVVKQSSETLQQMHWQGRIINPSGKIRWIQAASKPDKQADGSIIWDGLVIDISDRRQGEQELRKSQQLLRLVFDTLPQRVFWKDTNFNYLGCNQLFAQDAGLNSPEEIIGKNDFELSWHKSASLYHADDQLILAGGAPKINHEESQVLEDGSIKVLRTNKLALKDKNGHIIGIFGSYEDTSNISEQKQQIESAQDFLSKAFDSIKSPIFVKNTDHRWVLVNDAYCKFVGYSKEEMLGKSEPDFYSAEQADIYWAKDELVMLSGEDEIDEEPFCDEQGNEKILVTKKSCFTDLDGSIYLLGMIVDIYDA